jgi:WD40 repeat protein
MFKAVEIQSKNVTNIESLAFSPDSLFFAIAQQGISETIPNVLVYDISNLHNPTVIACLNTYHTPLLSFIRNGKSLIYSRDTNEIIEFDLQSNKTNKLPFLALQTKGIQTNKLGNMVAIHGLQQFIYNFDSEELVWLYEKELDSDLGDSFPIAISDLGDFFGIYDQEKSSIRIFETKNLVEIIEVKSEFDALGSIKFSPNGKFIAIQSSPDSYFSLFSMDKKKFLKFPQLPDDYFLTIKSIAFHPNNNFVFLGTMSGGLFIIDLNKKIILDSLDIGDKDIIVAAFSPDGKKFVFGGQDGGLKIIDTTEFEFLF